MNDAPVLKSGNVELALFGREHVSERYLGWINDPVTMRYTEARYRSYSREEAEAYVEASNAGASARLFRILSDGRHVGNLRLSDINYFHRRTDMAIIIGEPDCRGRGVGAAAIGLGARFAFSALALHKVTAGMYCVNQASVRAFEKAGFRTEALQKSHYFCEGEWVDGILMGKLAPDA
ncbi:MAG: GNAT family N-acetyltransferase [Alphaproteobacteria bacterium]|nr:GNAT family N-acetyltransferase [Alphaproteobacteria bacterium]